MDDPVVDDSLQDSAAAPEGERWVPVELQVAGLRRATRLLREFLVASDQFERSLRAALSVNATDLEAMEHLIMAGPLGPSELARRVGISTPSATTSVDRLVALGHVTREPHPTDRRAVMITPTPSSRDRAIGILIPMIRHLDAQLDGLTEAEQTVITAYLQRVVDACRDHVSKESADRG
ncbi:MarR family winged helix-turn-helix transcriptional regulator [Agromyces humatus]|uniref:HTH marR-type domain-containing protein n=1 Tax=Agromyces humatus TaxID=279573 RepID=A0ABP4X0B4_9MICO|nr:MarR family transcriptional regulator [Agromyces humatus]